MKYSYDKDQLTVKSPEDDNLHHMAPPYSQYSGEFSSICDYVFLVKYIANAYHLTFIQLAKYLKVAKDPIRLQYHKKRKHKTKNHETQVATRINFMERTHIIINT